MLSLHAVSEYYRQFGTAANDEARHQGVAIAFNLDALWAFLRGTG